VTKSWHKQSRKIKIRQKSHSAVKIQICSSPSTTSMSVSEINYHLGFSFAIFHLLLKTGYLRHPWSSDNPLIGNPYRDFITQTVD
jgi:hypothetical protein